MKVYIITEGNSTVGFGHISRCTSLYDAFKEKGIIPTFIINGDDSIKEFLVENSLIFDWVKDSEKLCEIIHSSDVVIIDSYLIDTLLAKKISEIVKVPVFIDDYNRIDYLRGLVINSSINATDINYPNKPEIDYLLGPKYSMLKKEFWVIPTKPLNESIETIMITFGGNDKRNITPKLIKNLKKNFPLLKKKVVIGKAYQNVEEIIKFSDKNCDLIYYPNEIEMRTIMLDSDIAITAGGQTSYELAIMGVPSITVAVANNQVNSVKKLEELKINFYAGYWNDQNLIPQILDYIKELDEIELRREMINNGLRYIKPNGSREIVEIIIKKFNDIPLKMKKS